MAYMKNTAGQKIIFGAFNKTTGNPVTNDDANISATFSVDGNSPSVVANTVDEIDNSQMAGYYSLELDAAETDGTVVIFNIASTSADVVIDPVAIYPSDVPATLAYMGGELTDLWEILFEDAQNFHEAGGRKFWETKLSELFLPSDDCFGTLASDLWNFFFDDTTNFLDLVALGVWEAGTAYYGSPDTYGSLIVSVDSDVSAIKSQTDQLSFTIANQVDSNALTGGSGSGGDDAATIYNYFTDVSREDLFKADVAGLALEATSQTIISTGGSGPWSSGANTGAGSVTFSLDVADQDSNPLEGCAVWISTDTAGTNVIAGTLYTNTLGQVTFTLDPGTYYVWKQLSGQNFTNPETITVTA